MIIDTAPLTVSNDAIVFGMDQRHYSRYRPRHLPEEGSKDLEESMDALRTAKIPVLGFVLNFANPEKKHRDAYYYYYYEDGVRCSTPRKRGRKH